MGIAGTQYFWCLTHCNLTTQSVLRSSEELRCTLFCTNIARLVKDVATESRLPRATSFKCRRLNVRNKPHRMLIRTTMMTVLEISRQLLTIDLKGEKEGREEKSLCTRRYQGSNLGYRKFRPGQNPVY